MGIVKVNGYCQRVFTNTEKTSSSDCSQRLSWLDNTTFSAGSIVEREWLQRRQMFRLLCHNFELAKPASWVNQKHRYRLGRFWVQFLGRYRPLALWSSAQTIGAEGLGLDSRTG